MAQPARKTRRIAGLLRSRLPELQLERVVDPRARRGRRWKELPVLLRTTLVGIMAGCKSIGETERLTEELSVPMQRMLRIGRRVPDTTLRQTLVRLEPDALRERLHVQIKAAQRRKALAPVGLPIGQVAVDGRTTTLPDVHPDGAPRTSDVAWAERFAQRQVQPSGSSCRLLRTDTCTLVSARARPCIDAVPIPAATNEMGHFATVVRGLVETYGRSELFQLISTDAGNCSEANGRLVAVELGLHYLFRLKADQPTLLAEAKRLLQRRKPETADAITEDVVGNTTVTRRLFCTAEMAGFMSWTHLQTVIRIRKETHDNATGKLLEAEDHYAVSSLPVDALSPVQWLHAFRIHWGVEVSHHIFDRILNEDDKPWIETDPKGMVAVLLLRRIAYNLLALYRSVTQRCDDRRQTPWKDLLRWIYNTLISAQAADLGGLRPRKVLMSGI